jgi:predicted amidohydrolase
MVVADLPSMRLGLTVCYDVRFPHLYRALAKAGADVIAVPAAFTRTTGAAHWHVLLRSRAIETGAFIVAAAQGGKHGDGRETYGHSLIVDPWGAVLAGADHAEPGFILAEIDPEQSALTRARIPSLANERDFAPLAPSAPHLRKVAAR